MAAASQARMMRPPMPLACVRAGLSGFEARDATEDQRKAAAAQLAWANLVVAQLEGADLRGASLDKAAHLNDATLKAVSLDQTIFDNTNLSVVPWQDVPILGNEVRARATKDDSGKRKSRQQRVEDYQAAA